jgi:predicted nucleic acid-binding protein
LEDNVLLASAHRSEADYVVTWDEALLRDASALVRAVTPTTMLTVLQSDDEE